jgi:hypothetical protein
MDSNPNPNKEATMAHPAILATLKLDDRYTVTAFQTRWNTVEFQVSDHMVEDPLTGLPSIVRQEDRLMDALQGHYLPGSDVAAWLTAAANSEDTTPENMVDLLAKAAYHCPTCYASMDEGGAACPTHS